MDAGRVDRALDQLVGDAVLSPQQADAVRAALAADPPAVGEPPRGEPPRGEPPRGEPPRGEPPRGIPPAAEAAAWVGAVLAVAAGFTAVAAFWNELTRWAQTGILALTAVALLAAGAAVHGDRRAAARRIVSVVWFLAVVAAGAAGVIGSSRNAADMRGWPWVLAGAVATAVAVPLWRRNERTLQLLAVAGSVLATLLAVLSVPDRVPYEWFGLVFWAVGAALIVLAWAELARPSGAALTIGGALALVGPQMLIFSFDQGRGGLALALGTVVVLFALGGALRHVPLTALAAAGLAVFVPQALESFFPDSLNASATLFISGVALLAGALATIRRMRDNDDGPPPPPPAPATSGDLT